MSTAFLMGNEAIAMGAIAAGINLAAGYPGTPSTEILETVAKNNDGSVYVEWSVNEKAALEVAAGASYSGARSLVTMKQVGLNVASDPLMSLAYIGIKGGMVIVSADDPGPISSQTEQDTRHFAEFSKLPVFDPSSPEEAYKMIKTAFEYSEMYGTPVLFRPTTRICHSCASVEIDDITVKHAVDGFVKDTKRWVIFPRTSYLNHIKIEERNKKLSDVFSGLNYNRIEYNSAPETEKNKESKRIAIAAGGISYAYTKEALDNDEQLRDIDYKLLKISTPHPFPEKLALDFMSDHTDKVIVFEELDPVIERELIYICGKHKLDVTIFGKTDGTTACAGENSVEAIAAVLKKFAGLCGSEAKTNASQTVNDTEQAPELPVRPPVLCAGCPHRASFYAVKTAMKGKKAVFSGDIGCYTLGNAQPLDMVDTCLCMGADVTIAQGIHRFSPDTVNFSFIGDSTFFASGITGVVNAVYNQTDIVLIVLDNSTTAMTGHQPHPGTGKTMMGNISQKVSIEKILSAIGVSKLITANPMNLEEAVNAVKEAAEGSGVRAIVFRAPCIAVDKPKPSLFVDGVKCIGCKKCIKELGCPALVSDNVDGKKVSIDSTLCFGCGFCKNMCPTGAINLPNEK